MDHWVAVLLDAASGDIYYISVAVRTNAVRAIRDADLG